MIVRQIGRSLTWFTLASCTAAFVMVAWFIDAFRAPGSLLPHGYCFTWNPALLWTHVISDSLIGVAYLSIPMTLLYLVRRRADMPFNWVVVLFATFIVSCGATHWIDVWTVWHPDYWLSGSVKALTASASLLTAAAMVYLVPQLLAIPTVSQLESAKKALELEVQQRRAVEAELRMERAALEKRVLLRTEELERATAEAHDAKLAAEQASLQKDHFLAKVSHELRTPLQSTLSWSQVLRRSDIDPERAARAADRIIHNVQLQARLIDDLLDISRILSGNLHLDYQEADALEVINRAAGVVRSTAERKGVRVDIISQITGATKVWTDPARLEQVVWNLLSNAVQASSEGGHVQLSIDVTETTLRLSVKDEGVGIDAADLANIFEPFRQGARQGGSHRGLGLGLAIVRHIVTLFSGEVTAHSDGPGRGAEFCVELPLGLREGVATAPIRAGLNAEQIARLARLRIVYVEDEPDIAEGCELMLRSLGVDVQTCLNFEQARSRLQEGGFDVLLTDLNLDQEHTGLELLQTLRQTSHGRHLPALILSAYGSDADRRASLAAGFYRHLVKPLDVNQLARALLDTPAGREPATNTPGD